MEQEHNVKLTSSEIAYLWGNYMNDSMSIRVIQFFLEKVEDAEIRPVLQYALELSRKHVRLITQIFQQEQFPIPVGFTDEDLNLTAPALFSDPFYLLYIQNMGKIGLNNYSVALSNVARKDILNFYSECMASSVELYNKANVVMLSKGLMSRAPYIPTPEKVDFVQKQTYLAGWFGEQRPLNVLEIANIFFNIQRNTLGRTLMMGFAQVAKSEDVSSYMQRGKNISEKHVEIFRGILNKNDLSAPVNWNTTPTASTVSPFSDKLMMFSTSALSMIGIGFYGMSLGQTMRRDLQAQYVRLTAEIGHFAEDGANIMIDHGWMEQTPQTADREELAKA